MSNLPRVGVFLRTYAWNSYAVRSAMRTFRQSVGADFLVLADETRSGAIAPPLFEKIGHTTEDFVQLGLPAVASRGEVLWWNCDYGLYDACLKCPDYDYYFLVEDDVAVNLPLLPIAHKMAAHGIDCVTFGGHRKIDTTWVHHASCGDLPYDKKTWTALTVMFVSADAARFLLAERQRLATLFATGQMSEWPFCEGFFSSALLNGGYRTADLRKFATTPCFGANATYLETDERTRQPGSLAHAVLEKERYGPKFFARTFDSLLRMASYCRLSEARVELRESGFSTFENYRVLPGDGNLALDKPATQSSVSKWSRPPGHHTFDPLAIDARGGNCGVLTGNHGFHTEGEDNPWWAVDLEQVHAVDRVRIYNGALVPGRARQLSVQVSEDGQDWTRVYQKTDNRVFSGNDDPLVCSLSQPVRARHVRVMLDATGPLHLAEIEVYGPPASGRS